MHFLFYEIPAKLLTWLILVITAVVLVLRYLTGTMVGVLISSLILYNLMPVLGETKPFSLFELLLWFSELPRDSQAGIGIALITVLGFVIAFYTASINWKEQTRTKLRVAAAEEIESFFAEIAKLIIDVSLYAGSVIEYVPKVQKSGRTHAIALEIRTLISDTPEFLEARKRMSSLSVQIHRFQDKYNSLLVPRIGAMSSLKYSTDAFAKIADDMVG